MKAYITSIGEPTTELCVWSLERQGYDVTLLQDGTTLWNKMKKIYDMADSDFLRVDADVICNRFVKELKAPKDAWWVQGLCFGWLSQTLIHGGVQLYKKEALPYLRVRVDEAEHYDRPETYMTRIPEFYEPRRFVSSDLVCGIHGFMQSDYDRIYKIKSYRGQLENYDFEWVKRVNAEARDFYNSN